jgi:hypothetical protein
MKNKIILLLLLAFTINSYAQDTCKPVIPAENDGFDYNVRLDTAKKNYLQNLFDSAKFKFTYDYAGTLGNPGLLFNDVNFSGYDLLSGSLSFSDKNNVQKIGFAPFRLSDKIENNLLRNTSIGITLKNAITTFGLSVGGNNADPKIRGSRGKKFRKWQDELVAKAKFEIPAMYPKACQDIIINKNAREAARIQYLYDSMRTRNVFTWGIGYSVQLFQFLSTKSDNNPLFDSLNYFGLKANIISVKTAYSYLNGKLQLNGNYSNSFLRKGADKSQKKITYHAFLFSASLRVVKFLKGEKLKMNADFIKSQFVPAIHIGISYDNKFTKGDYKFVEDGIFKTGGVTPFLQFLVTPASAFSIGFPIVKSKTVTDVKTSQVSAMLQYKFSLANLAN